MQASQTASPADAIPWQIGLRRYALALVAANLVWEIAQLPLYSIWHEGSLRENIVAVVHCTVGDAVIALSTLSVAIILFGGRDWPGGRTSFVRVAAATIAIALAYTLYSEWTNVSVRRNWTYSAWMPVVPGIGTGLTPLLQWIVAPAIGFWMLRRPRRGG